MASEQQQVIHMKRTVSIGQSTGKVLKVTFSSEDVSALSSLSGGSPKLGMQDLPVLYAYQQHYGVLVSPS